MKRDKGGDETCLALVVSHKSFLDGKLISLSFLVLLFKLKWRAGKREISDCFGEMLLPICDLTLCQCC